MASDEVRFILGLTLRFMGTFALLVAGWGFPRWFQPATSLVLEEVRVCRAGHG